MNIPEISEKLDPIRDKMIFITGATSGLGRELAILFNLCRSQVIIHGRSKDKLDNLTSILFNNNTKKVIGDLKTEDGIKVVESAIQYYKPEILILNAGYNVDKTFVNKLRNDDINEMMNVNLVSSMRFSVRFADLPKLKESRTLILILSTSCYFPREQMSLYIAAKSGLMGFGKSLQQEAKALNLRTILVYPGRINSNFRKTDNQNYMNPKSVAFAIAQLLCLPHDIVPYEFIFRPEIDTTI